jgi:MYXO-CTERM domain-containing protein
MSNSLNLTAAIAVLGFAFATPASAVTSFSTYSFEGTCSDCSGTVTGVLTLSGSYAADIGQSIGTDFSSFTYNGSNLLGPFTINSLSSGLAVSGTLEVSPSVPNLSIADTANNFRIISLGNWCAGTTAPCATGSPDMGISGDLSTPEPGTAPTALLGALGLAGLSLWRRRHLAAPKNRAATSVATAVFLP